MATLPEMGAKATNGSNAIPEAGSSWPSWPRASDLGRSISRHPIMESSRPILVLIYLAQTDFPPLLDNLNLHNMTVPGTN